MRLHNSTEYRDTFEGGIRYKSKSFIIFIREKKTGPTRLGLTVNRKVGGAVIRNKIKRIMRDIFRLNYSQLFSQSDIVIIVNKTATYNDYDQLKQEFMNVCCRK